MIGLDDGDDGDTDDYPAKSVGFPEPSLPEFETCRDLLDNPHRYARNWKARTGGQVVACFGGDVPRELLSAAGLLPVRAYGGRNPDELVIGDEHHFRKLCCPFSRDVLAQGLLGRYDYVDGAVLAGYCFHMRQTYEGWVRHVLGEDAFVHAFLLPSGTQVEGGSEFLATQRGEVESSAPTQGLCPHAPAEYLAATFGELTAALEAHTGSVITEDDRHEAIGAHDRTRELLREIYEYRTEASPRISGLEAMELVKAGQLTAPSEYNQLLERVRDRLAAGEGRRRPTDHRLMLVTVASDDRRLVNLVEEGIDHDATVVIEDSDAGSRDFWNTVADPGGVPWTEETDALTDLARRYAERPPYPSKDWSRRRDHLRRLATDFDVDGAVLVMEKRCDLHQRDIPYEERLFEDALDVPTLTLVSDEAGLPSGQLRTRIEAFIERLTTGELRGLF